MRAILLVTLLSGFVLAGCLGGGGDDVDLEDDGAARATEATGSVTGQVFNEELNAVVNASIWVVDAERNLVGEGETRSDGRYTVNELPPGSYRLQVSHVCCRQEIKDITITAGEVLNGINFQLALTDLPHIIDPRVETDEWVGFIGCSHGIPPPFWVHCSALDSQHDESHLLDLEPGLRTLSIGITWNSGGSQFGMSENQLNVVVELHVPGNAVELADVTAENPITLRFDNSELGDKAFEQFDDEEIGLKIMTRGPELTLMYQQAFTVYWALHYWHEAPEGYTVLPDA